ncbi:YqgE/AlgH family protein [Agaribacterium haliotis]|uniref:YqgE/AlgH family protein n=1 Tax=Agaribacterium haliotis TaxID=2013869 RepID=UPI000BB5310F|nr:YqgE/AlgH family protein [Agaribacterium haliotis]
MTEKTSFTIDKCESLRNQFLIAMPGLDDSLFSHSLTFICDHNKNGAMGLIINQPLGINLSDVFQQLQLESSPALSDAHVLAGGPVNSQQGLVLHRDEGHWESTLRITPDICLTASKDIVEAMANNQGPSGAQLALGYAGWSAGQLEEELSNNMWLTMPADNAIIFDTPTEQRWNAAAQALGVDLNLISSAAGHA